MTVESCAKSLPEDFGVSPHKTQIEQISKFESPEEKRESMPLQSTCVKSKRLVGGSRVLAVLCPISLLSVC
jgi:hypothetical protein